MLKNVASIITPILNREINHDGIYKIPDILEQARDLIYSSDVSLSKTAINLFVKVTNELPIYTPKDLLKLY